TMLLREKLSGTRALRCAYLVAMPRSALVLRQKRPPARRVHPPTGVAPSGRVDCHLNDMDANGTIPGHLRRFIVRQDYEKYTAEDQAVWRFVVLQTHARLLTTAHEAYADGFSAAGISVDRIPSIDEMNERLERFGWGAVCVDGFIPPRAF